LIKNSQPFGKNFQKILGGIFLDSHCRCRLGSKGPPIWNCIRGIKWSRDRWRHV